MKINELDDIFKNNLDGYRSDFDTEEGWTALEPRLEKKKKRRLFFLLFFAAGIISTTSFLLLLPTENNTRSSNAKDLMYNFVNHPDDLNLAVLNLAPEYDMKPINSSNNSNSPKNTVNRKTLLSNTDTDRLNQDNIRETDSDNEHIRIQSTQSVSSNSDQSGLTDVVTKFSNNDSFEGLTSVAKVGKDSEDVQSSRETNTDLHPSTGSPSNNSSSTKDLDGSDERSEISSLSNMTSVKIHQKLESKIDHIPAELPFSYVGLTESEADKRPKWAVSIEGGGGIYSHNYRYIVDEPFPSFIDPSTFLKSQESLSAAVRGHLQINNRWNLSAGIEYNRISERFTYSGTEAVSRQTEGIQTIFYNPTTGDSTFVVGTVTQTGTQLREVNHYNSFSNWNIPIGVNYKMSTSKLSFNPGLGLIMNISSRKSGKELYIGEVTDSDLSQLYSSNVGLSLYFEGQLEYRLSPSMAVTFSPSVRKSASNWTNRKEVILKPLFYNAHIGLKLSF